MSGEGDAPGQAVFLKHINKYFLILLVLVAGCSSDRSSARPSHRADWSVQGTQPDEQNGFRAGGVGDVNGDGHDDFVIGAKGYDKRRGRVSLYTGGAQGLSPLASWTVRGESEGDRFGEAVGAAGDLNKDGFADIFVCAIAHQGKGKLYIYYGGPDGLSSSPGWTAVGENEKDNFGDASAAGGDINGDGYDDLLVGSYGFQGSRGRIFVYLGGPQGLEHEAAWSFAGENDGDWFGYSVAGVGDVNKDGFADFMVSAKNCSGTCNRWFTTPPEKSPEKSSEVVGSDSNRGKAYLFLGGKKGPVDKPAWVRHGEGPSSLYGFNLDGVGDINGDGFDDVLVSASGFARGKGRISLFLGNARGLESVAVWQLDGAEAGVGLGRGLAGLGDVNGDGYPDFIVGGSGHRLFGGTAQLWLGGGKALHRMAWSSDAEQKAVAEYQGNYYGDWAGSAGDVNSDGLQDWFVSAPGYPNAIPGAGKVYTYYGRKNL